MTKIAHNKDLKKILKKYQNKIDNLVHVGAHLGQEVPLYQSISTKKIYLFEPQKSLFNDLKNSLKQFENIFVYNCGLGSQNKFINLYKTKHNNGASSSVLKPHLHLNLHKNINFDEKEEIQIKRFDSLNIKNIDFLTIDVQGYELEVLRGFGKLLENLNFIYTEINKDFLYENNVLIKELDIFLESKNFIRLKTFWDPYLPYGDAFFVKNININRSKILFYRVKKTFQDSFIYLIILRMIHINKGVFKIKQKIKKIFLD